MVETYAWKRKHVACSKLISILRARVPYFKFANEAATRASIPLSADEVSVSLSGMGKNSERSPSRRLIRSTKRKKSKDAISVKLAVSIATRQRVSSHPECLSLSYFGPKSPAGLAMTFSSSDEQKPPIGQDLTRWPHPIGSASPGSSRPNADSRHQEQKETSTAAVERRF
ncbi:hypothetical protein CISG_05120 [Coccidioides immitis RMSCC 3703]|uniref:Uncharacterized protein n=1 Tax=Coccidioides immitis RMSCC 3703 TaxID=454286 RepID=A0A0J8QSN2_COCIT|nr:hypothetical protein CISG_05120 [Coccidioides immitis RMSCC 3703]